MLYLLDANVLIDANRDYYEIGRVDEYWEWLVHQGENDNVKIPLEIYEEIKSGNDALAQWAKDDSTQAALKLDEDVDIALVRKATNEGYAPDLTDIEIEKIGRDPFLVAYGLREPQQRCIVTTEVSKPRKQRANRHIPDVCALFDIATCNGFAFARALNFNTNWKAL